MLFIYVIIKTSRLSNKFKLSLIEKFLENYFTRKPINLILNFKLFIRLDVSVIKEFLFAGMFEPLTTSFILKHVKKDSICIDIGAHIGYYSILFSKIVGERGKVIAIEPDPINLYYLRRNLQLNNCNNVILLPFAIADYEGEGKLSLDLATGLDTRLNTEIINNRKIIKVKVRKLDNLLMHSVINLIKIDVQGSELLVFKGAIETLKKTNIIVFEYSPSLINEPYELFLLLSSLNFKLYYIDQNKNEITKDEFLKLTEYLKRKNLWINLVAIKNERF